MRRLTIYIILAIIVMVFASKVTSVLTEKKSVQSIEKVSQGENCPSFNYKKLGIASSEVKIEVVCTNQSRAKGLSGRASLASSTGMLFVFDTPTAQNFWMKEMNFPIDIVWIDDNFRVVDIIYDARPESYPNLFTSPKSVKYVLELNSGEALKFSLKKGLALVPLE